MNARPLRSFDAVTNFVYTAFKKVVYTVFVAAVVASVITALIMLIAYKIAV